MRTNQSIHVPVQTNPAPDELLRRDWIESNISGGTASAEIHRAATAPQTPHSYKVWVDTSTTPPTVREWTGAAWQTVQADNPAATTHAARTDNPHAVTATQTGAVAATDHTKAAHDAMGIDAATLDGIDSTALQTRSEKGQASGYAPLDASSLVPEVHIPAVAISDTYEVATEAAMLALAAQRGDVAIRSDLNKSFILRAAPASTLANWSELRTPTDAVLSVDGRTGAVTLSDLYKAIGYVPAWTEVTGKPATFPPDAHNQALSTITGHDKAAHDAMGIDAATLDGIDSTGFAPAAHVGSRDGHPLATDALDGMMGSGDKAKLDGLSVAPKGHILGGALKWDSATAYSVETGEALINGALLSWSAAIARSPALAASTLYYVYLYDSAGAAAAEESTTEPVWDSALGYYQKGADGTRRCIGFYTTDSGANIRRFWTTIFGRTRETIYTAGEVLTALSGGTFTTGWASVSLAAFVPVHAALWYAAAKVSFPAAGDGIVGVSPVNLGSTVGTGLAPFSIRSNNASSLATKFFAGRAWLPVGASRSVFYRISQLSGSPEAELEVHGARFLA